MTRSDTRTDLLIVGGGVLGAFHAYESLRRGLSVALVERNSAPRGATVRNFGQVVPSGFGLHWQAFGRESLAIYKEIQSKTDITVRQNGSIYIASNDDELALIEELRTINADADYRSELWTAEKCRERYPSIRRDYCRGGLYFPEEMSVDPRAMIHRLHEFLAEDATYQASFNTYIREVYATEGRQVRAVAADGRTWTAEKAIICSGTEFGVLFPELYRASDLTEVKLQMLRLTPEQTVQIPGNILTGWSIRRYEAFAECPSWRDVNERETPDRFAAEMGIHVLFKQEADGGIILGDSHEYSLVSQSVPRNFDVRADINDYLLAEGRRIMDLPSWDVEATWIGHYCQTQHPSGVFARTIDDNIHIVTGIGGKGMTGSAGFSKHHLAVLLND